MKKHEIYERVAELVPESPCGFVNNEIVVNDKWCEENCNKATHLECWKHAIKEGWRI